MKPFPTRLLVPLLVVSFLSACKDAGSPDHSEKESKEIPGTERTPETRIPENRPASSAIADSIELKPASNEIISHIDNYLVSEGHLQEATVTVRNTLPNITFQKAIVEVSSLRADGSLIRTDYFPIQNIEPGDLETIRLVKNTKTASLETHIVKIKSNALTNGEMILAGSHFIEKK